jgi:hypothetical protein
MKQMTGKSNPGAVEKRTQDFFRFEDFTREFTGGSRVSGVIRVDHLDGFRNFA